MINARGSLLRTLKGSDQKKCLPREVGGVDFHVKALKDLTLGPVVLGVKPFPFPPQKTVLRIHP
jgi:hypothetical protein